MKLSSFASFTNAAVQHQHKKEMVIEFYNMQIEAKEARADDVEIFKLLSDPIVDAAISVLACANILFELPFMSVSTCCVWR